MRTKAAEACKALANDRARMDDEGMSLDDEALGAYNCAARILALPLEADHAALLAEALAVIKAAGFVVYEKLPDFSKMDEQELNHWRVKMNAWGADMRHEQADAIKRISAALLALETP